ncbi:hypothetical protein F2P81_004754 [Scophthalmus maximus]|uniref:Uncharacterized protein n=1 Tax=Scophthalmus maximus TaxID=52904 RepID=A0A6A4TAE4_SCOMX|nr:hypothetical protein F2P81_004754 [Scophthalmus maximus]
MQTCLHPGTDKSVRRPGLTHGIRLFVRILTHLRTNLQQQQQLRLSSSRDIYTPWRQIGAKAVISGERFI